MDWFRRTTIATEQPIRSLCFRGNDLVDWVRGGDAWTAEGTFISAGRSWGYGRFDAAVSDAKGTFAVVHERTGTCGIVLREGKIVREIHRSPYHADAFLYPLALWEGEGGRTLLAHCPDSYARIEIEDAESGERLTRSDARKEQDFFHSRLAVSPGRKRLASAGWVWHPWDAVVWFDVAASLKHPPLLDDLVGTQNSRYVDLAEESSAAWLDDDRILLGSSSQPEDPTEVADAERERPGKRLVSNGLAIYDVAKRVYVESFELGYPPGTMMPVGETHVVTFFEHPRLVSLKSGAVVHAWTDIECAKVVSSIVHEQPFSVLALDSLRLRFAVGTRTGIESVCIEPTRLPS